MAIAWIFFKEFVITWIGNIYLFIYVVCGYMLLYTEDEPPS